MRCSQHRKFVIGGNRGKTVQVYKKSWPASLSLAPLHRTLNHVAKTQVPNATVSVRTPCHHGRIRTSTRRAARCNARGIGDGIGLTARSLKLDNGVPQSQSGLPQRTRVLAEAKGLGSVIKSLRPLVNRRGFPLQGFFRIVRNCEHIGPGCSRLNRSDHAVSG
jgi:hypothetical protein